MIGGKSDKLIEERVLDLPSLSALNAIASDYICCFSHVAQINNGPSNGFSQKQFIGQSPKVFGWVLYENSYPNYAILLNAQQPPDQEVIHLDALLRRPWSDPKIAARWADARITAFSSMFPNAAVVSLFVPETDLELQCEVRELGYIWKNTVYGRPVPRSRCVENDFYFQKKLP